MNPAIPKTMPIMSLVPSELPPSSLLPPDVESVGVGSRVSLVLVVELGSSTELEVFDDEV